MSGFLVFSLDTHAAKVCTVHTAEDAVTILNELYPTGGNAPWRLDTASVFAGSLPNPCPCDDQPDTHRHILFTCRAVGAASAFKRLLNGTGLADG